MDSAAALLFTSSIDNQPLVIIEALCAGLPVLWTESQAAREILAPFGVEPVASADDVLAELNHGFSKSGWSRWRRREISKLALERFGSSEMVDKYFNLYNELMSC
jgi:glycosyltransferase involved in cell wall biosynthesis